MVRLRTLGGFVVTNAAGERISLPPHRVALLALIVAAGDRGIARDKLLAYLWPDATPPKARAALEQMLHALRISLEDRSALLGNPLHVDATIVSSDITEFHAALATGDLQRAVAVYGGPFLDGFHLAGVPEFDEWLEGERSRLARQYGAALQTLAIEAATRGDDSKAVEWLHALGAYGAFSAPVIVRLIETLAEAGNRDGALEFAVQYTSRVRAVLGVEPDPSVAAAIDRLRSREPSKQPDAVKAGPREQPVQGIGATEILSPAVVMVPPKRTSLLGVAFAIAAIIVAGVIVITWLQARAEIDEQPLESIVVLPFDNLSGDTTQNYFVAGMHDAIIAQLAQMSRHRVISRQSSMHYAGSNQTIPEIANELGIDAVVDGSISRVRDSVRVQIQVIKAKPERHIWSEKFSRRDNDVLALQAEIAAALARSISGLSGTTAMGNIAAKLPRPLSLTEAAAYDEYLRGRYFMAEAPPALQSAIRHFENAIARDSTFAPAYAGLGEAYCWWGLAGFPELISRCRVAARTAVDLDPTLPEAHVALGWARITDWDWVGSETAFKRAIELNPNASAAHQHYGHLLRILLRLDEAAREAQLAVQLDPFNLTARSMVGWILWNQRRYDDAFDVYARVLELEPQFGLAIYNQGQVHWMRGDANKVIDAAARAKEARLTIGELHGDWLQAIGLALAGRHAEARRVLKKLRNHSAIDVPHSYFGIAELALGNETEALNELERGFAAREPVLPLITSEPIADPLRQHPRFRSLRSAMRVP